MVAPPLRIAFRLAFMGAVLLSSGASAAQDGRAIFRPLLADPHEPEFFATYLFARTSHLAPRIGSVGLGQTIALVDARDPGWQLAVSAGVFSQFDVATTTTHLMNTDYIIGVPVSRRWGARSARLRVYHQSSHLGEEFPDGGAVRRQLLSFEALEVLFADELANWRIYGGGEYRFQHTPDDLAPAVAHPPRHGRARAARRGARRQVIRGPRLAGGLEPEDGTLVRDRAGRREPRSPLEHHAGRVPRADALRAVLPGEPLIRRPRRRAHALMVLVASMRPGTIEVVC